MTLAETLYSTAAAAARPLLPVAGLFSPSLARGIAGHRAALADLREWAAAGREGSRPLLWLHGASAGELLGAVSAVRVLRGSSDPPQLLVTYFSPSAEEVAAALEPDHAGYLPLDTLHEMRAAIEAVRPKAIVFSKLDVWPNLTRAAVRARVPLGLINGTVRPGSSRLSPLARTLLRPAYGRLALAGAVSEEDGARLIELGARPEAVRVTGDAAFDLALERARRAGAERGRWSHIFRFGEPPSGRDRLRLIAGSTWPEDEEVLLAAAAALAAAGRDFELVLVPHRPSREAVSRLRRRCREVLDVPARLWSEAARAPAGDVRPEPQAGNPLSLHEGTRRLSPLIVDTIGVLSELYTAGDLAYVGGGFGQAGLHSVIEPAAAAVPVLFGPNHERREAMDLLARGGAAEIADREESAVQVIGGLLADAERRSAMGRAARAYVESGAGAGKAGARLIAELLAAARAAVR